MGEDPVVRSLHDLADAARANIADWEYVLRRAEVVFELRRRGVRYSDMDLGEGPTLIAAITRNQERLAASAAAFRRAMAHQLVAEGWSQASIATMFGVSRQRVAALLQD